VPEISRFFGIVIGMFFSEHGKPHFHAVYAGIRSLLKSNHVRFAGSFLLGRGDASF
jgi:hypothetical protein